MGLYQRDAVDIQMLDPGVRMKLRFYLDWLVFTPSAGSVVLILQNKKSHEVQDLFQVQFALFLLITFPAKLGVLYLKILPKKLLLRSKRRKNGDQVGKLLAGASWKPIARGDFRLLSGELLSLSVPFLLHSPSPIEEMHKKIMAVYLLSEIF